MDEIYKPDFLDKVRNEVLGRNGRLKGEMIKYCQGKCILCNYYDKSNKNNYLEPGKGCPFLSASG